MRLLSLAVVSAALVRRCSRLSQQIFLMCKLMQVGSLCELTICGCTRRSLQRSGQSRVEKDGEEGQDETLGALAPPGPPWPFLPLPTHPMLAVNASQSHPLAKQMTAQ